MPYNQKIPEEDIKLYHIFADETCQVSHEWMALGTTAVSDEHLAHVRAMFRAWKVKLNIHGEIKWVRTDKKNLESYKALITVYFGLLKQGILQFHAMTIPMADFDPRALGDDVPEASYNRCFHHLLLQRYCGGHPQDRRPIKDRKYQVIFDKRTSKVLWEPFRIAACRAAARDYLLDHSPFRSIEYEDSLKEMMLQVNDLILGAVGFWWNNKHNVMPTKTSPKGKLVQHVANHLKEATGNRSMFEIPYRSRSFTIWELKFNALGVPERELCS